MARPRKHYGKWRIRWVDEHRGRHSETFDTRDEAVFAQQKHELEVKKIKRGLRGSIQPNKRSPGSACRASRSSRRTSATFGRRRRWPGSCRHPHLRRPMKAGDVRYVPGLTLRA